MRGLPYQHKGCRIAFSRALFALFLYLAVIVPHATAALASSQAFPCAPHEHHVPGMTLRPNHIQHETVPQSPSSKTLPLKACCSLWCAGIDLLAPGLFKPFAVVETYRLPSASVFASIDIGPEPPPPRC
jgi:hypothetical protein